MIIGEIALKVPGALHLFSLDHVFLFHDEHVFVVERDGHRCLVFRSRKGQNPLVNVLDLLVLGSGALATPHHEVLLGASSAHLDSMSPVEFSNAGAVVRIGFETVFE